MLKVRLHGVTKSAVRKDLIVRMVIDIYAQPVDMDLASVKTKICVLVNALKVFTVLKGAPKRMKEPVEVHLIIVRRAVRLQFKLRLAISHMRRQRKHLVGALGYPEESFYTALTTTNTTGLRKTAEAICDPGHYCVDGVRLECPIGRYGESYGLTNSDCTAECEPGYYCNKASKVKNEHECGDSHLFCPRGSGVPKHVHLGYYTIGNTMSTRYGERLCELGMYCNYTTGMQFQCPAGKYGDTYGLSDNGMLGKLFCRVLLSSRLRHAQQEHCNDPNFYCPEGTPTRQVVDKGYHAIHVAVPPCTERKKTC